MLAHRDSQRHRRFFMGDSDIRVALRNVAPLRLSLLTFILQRPVLSLRKAFNRLFSHRKSPLKSMTPSLTLLWRFQVTLVFP